MTEHINTGVACIGGGPASAFAAIEVLRSHQIDVDLFEEHKSIGYPVNCAGLVSVDGFRKLGVVVPKEGIQNRVQGSIFYSPAGYRFAVSRKKAQALVIDRKIFDQHLIDVSEELGAKIHLHSKVLAIRKLEKRAIGLEVKDDQAKKFVDAKIIVDGEGVRTNFITAMGLSPTRIEDLVPTIQYDMKNVDVDPNIVEIFIGRKIAPGFFAYIIPLSESTARVAVGSKFGKTLDYITHFIKKHPIAAPKLENGVIIKRGGGFVHIGGPIKKTYAPGFLGVGDAVGHVKATTGGGVVFGGLCAKIAGQVAVEAILSDNVSETFLKKYQVKWQSCYLKELMLMKTVRRLLNAIPDKMIDELFLALTQQRIPALIEKIGDMDMQGALIKEILFSPKILRIGLTMLTGLLFHL